MTTSHDPTRPDPTNRSESPSVAEIAALTARLRALSAAGAAADEDERAAFLADKQELIDRITAESDPARGQGRTRHTHHAQIRPTDGPTELYVGISRGDPTAGWSPMPAEMRAGIHARHDGPARVDTPDELAARIAALRARVDAQDADGIDAAAPTTTYDVGDDTGHVHEAALTDDPDADADGYPGGWPR